MSNNPQILGGGSLQPSRTKAPADSPTVAVKQPNLSFLGQRIRPGMKGSWVLENAKATKTKTDNKTSLSGSGTDWDSFMKPSDVNPYWDKIIPADKLAKINAEEEKNQHEAYITKVAAEGAPRRTAISIRKRNMELEYRLEKIHVKFEGGEYWLDQNFFENAELSLTSSPEGEHGYSSPGPHGSLPPHCSTDTLLDCRLRSTHYTISQDHTSGQEAHEDSLLASFGKRRRIDKPSMSLGGSRLLQRSPNLLPSVANGNDVVAQNEGSGMQKISQDDLDFLNNWKPIGSMMPDDAVSIPQETATTKPNEGKNRGDEVGHEWVRRKERRTRVKSPALRNYLNSQDRDAYVVDKSGDGLPASLEHRCYSCNRTSIRVWRQGPDVARRLCRPRSRPRAVTDPFHVAATSLEDRASKISAGKVVPATKRLRYTNIAREGHLQQYSGRPIGRIIPWVRGSLPATSRRPGKPPMTIATNHQQHQSPQAHIGSVVDTNNPDYGVSRVRHLRGLHPLYPSPTPEVPQSTVRPTSGDAFVVGYVNHVLNHPGITRTTARDGLSMDDYAAKEQPGHGIPRSKVDSMSMPSTSMEGAALLPNSVLNVEATTYLLIPRQRLPRSVLVKTSSPL